MTLTEKYHPKWNEIVGNEKAVEKLEQCVKESTPCLLHGGPGIGKTSSVYAIAEKLGLRVMETNASDERRKDELCHIYAISRMKGLRNFIIFLDEVDGLQEAGMVVKILEESKHPVVLAANEIYKVPQAIKEKCVEIKFFLPSLTDVLKRVKTVGEREGIHPHYEQVCRDVRVSINATMYGGEKYEVEDDFSKVKNIFRKKEIGEINETFLVWLMDNASRFYSGRELYEAIKVIASADVAGRMELLRLLPKGKDVEATYPYFFRRLRVLKGKGGISIEGNV